MILNHVFVKLKSKTSNTRNKIGDVRASDHRMSQPSSYIVLLFQLQPHVAKPVAGGGGLLKRKTNNQDLFVVILMLTCAWQTSILLWLSSLTARKLIFLCLL